MRCLLHGEYVDKDSLVFENAVVAVHFRHVALQVAQLGIAEEIVFVGVGRLQRQMVGQFRGQYFHQPEIVFAEHLHVEVVVPGDISSVAYLSQQRAGTNPVSYLMFLADAVEHLQHFGHPVLLSADERALGVKSAAQCFLVYCHIQFR